MFVCPVIGSSIHLYVQLVKALNVCVLSQWRVYNYGGSIRWFAQSLEVLYVCVSRQ